LIYVTEEDNIREDGEYYYLTKLAVECSSKRLVPDYISEKVMKQLKGDIYPVMGCRSALTPDDGSCIKVILQMQKIILKDNTSITEDLIKVLLL
jgi:hypothetical protein